MQKKVWNILKEYWGYDAFRGSQEKIILEACKGNDVFALLPTGGGKSVCYQVPALALDGICIVISPLVALIQDQVNQLKSKGIKAIGLTGGTSYQDILDILDNCLYGNYKFLYLSPERLQQSIVQERIKEMKVNLIAIDEAHCISQWGHDFRPAYLNTGILRELAEGVPFMALTATATPRVMEDIIQNLGLQAASVFKDSFFRPNLIFKVQHTEDKLYQLKKYLNSIPGSAIIYVRSRKMSISLSAFLNKNHFDADYFHGGIPKQEKIKKLQHWVKTKNSIIVATNAFGMGVDKPDVRLVIHYQIPDSIESYFQEAGRAGRDGKKASAIMLTSNEDKEMVKQQFLNFLPDALFVKTLYRQLSNYFQISYGESTTETFGFQLNDFCTRYGFNTAITYNGLRVLDQNSVISLSENFTEKTLLRFIASKAAIFDYLDKHPKNTPVIQTILRTYGGIMEYNTTIKLDRIAMKTNVDEKTIKKLLEQLKTDGIVEYESRTGDLEIAFLVPREDNRTINIFAKKIDGLNTVKKNNIDQMLAYIEETKTCRNVFLLNYFGETKVEVCNTCDICTEKEVPSLEFVKSEILNTLQLRPCTSRQLVEELSINERVALASLKELLEEDIIILNHKNEYTIEE